MIDNRIFIPFVIFVLILTAAFYCAGQPRPALEQFHPAPYIAPPTTLARAAQAAQNESNRLARAAHRAAVASLAASLGAPTGTTYKATMDRAKLFEDLAKQKGRGK